MKKNSKAKRNKTNLLKTTSVLKIVVSKSEDYKKQEKKDLSDAVKNNSLLKSLTLFTDALEKNVEQLLKREPDTCKE